MKILTLNRKSFALILAVFVLLAFSITGMTVVSVLSRRTANYSGQIDSLKTFYAARAARNYYLEKISFAAAFTDPDAAVFTKTLGGATCSISYKTQSARSATIVFTGTTTANRSYKITRLVEENSQTTDPSRVTSPTVVDQLRRFNLMIWASTDPSGYIRINRDCLDCDNCGSHGACYTLLGQNFFANTYFNAPLWLTGAFYKNNCSAQYNYHDLLYPTYSTRSRAVWGASGIPKNLYVNSMMDFSGIFTPATNYGVFGTAYYKGWGGVPTEAFHGGSVDCSIPANLQNNSECQNWPTVKPTIDLVYYDTLLTRAASSAIGTTLIDTSSSIRQLNNRNIFINGSVTINTTDASPLQGPGNIIATGSITINNNAFIREKVGLIAAGNITIGTSTRIGGAGSGSAGYDTTNQLIIGAGVLIYSRSGVTDFKEGSRVKAFCILKDSSDTNSPNTQVKFYINRTPAGTGPCDSRAYSQLQGLVYAEEMPAPAHLGYIYGNALIEKIPSDPGKPWPNDQPTTGLGLGNLYDTFPAASGRGATISELPLRIRGLYNLLITTP